MENFYLDRLRSNTTKLNETRDYLIGNISGRRCIILGAAPDPVMPATNNDYIICVNGSVYSAYKYLSHPPHLTYLNGAIFKNSDHYSKATLGVLENKDLGDVLVSQPVYNDAIRKLVNLNSKFGHSFPLSKYEKRVILGEVLGHTKMGKYRHEANVSNGMFMSAIALWCNASEVVLVGFSFNNQHEYSKKSQLSTRGHVKEDSLYLRLVALMKPQITTTSKEIHSHFNIRLHT